MFDLDLDLENVQASTGFDVLPKGQYPVQVESAELKKTKDEEGAYIQTTFVIIGGDYANRKLFHNFNIKNKNDEAVKIGLSEIKALIVASGATTTKITSPEQIVGLECDVKIKIVKEEGYEDKNRIIAFKKTEGSSAPAGSQAAASDVPKGADGKPIF